MKKYILEAIQDEELTINDFKNAIQLYDWLDDLTTYDQWDVDKKLNYDEVLDVFNELNNEMREL